MSHRLYLGNLSFKLNEGDLSELFDRIGIKTAMIEIVREPGSGKSRGFAFAELPRSEDLPRAIEELNGRVVDGRARAGSEARPRSSSR